MFITIWLTDLSWASFFFFNFLLIRCSLSLPPYYFSRFLPSMNLTREIACSLLIHPPLLPAWTVTAERTAAPEYTCPPDPPPGELFSEVSEIWVTGACSSIPASLLQHPSDEKFKCRFKEKHTQPDDLKLGDEGWQWQPKTGPRCTC